MSTPNNNYNFFENFFLPVNVAPNQSNATSPDQIPQIVKENIITTEINRCLTKGNATDPHYGKYQKLIFAPEEEFKSNPDYNFDADFKAVIDDIVENIDIVNLNESDGFFGADVNVLINVFGLREWLKSREEIICKNGGVFENGCNHQVPAGATHVTFGVPRTSAWVGGLSLIYPSKEQVPAHERETPYYYNGDNGLVSAHFPADADISDPSWWEENSSGKNNFLPAGVYIGHFEEIVSDAVPSGLFYATILSGDINLNQEIIISKQYLKTVTWDLSGLNKEIMLPASLADSHIDQPVHDPPLNALNYEDLLDATHHVRPHLNLEGRPQSTRLYSKPQKGTDQLATLAKDTCLQLLEQSIGKGLMFHRVRVADLESPHNNKEGYVYAPDIRPIYMPRLISVVDTPENKTVVGESPLLSEKPAWETLSSKDGPWFVKDKDGKYWNDCYKIVGEFKIPVDDFTALGVAGGDTPGTSEWRQFSPSIIQDAVNGIVKYFDKSVDTRSFMMIYKLMSYLTYYNNIVDEYDEGSLETTFVLDTKKDFDMERTGNIISIKGLVSIPARFIDAIPNNDDDFSFDYEPNLDEIRKRYDNLLTLEIMAKESDLTSQINLIDNAIKSEFGGTEEAMKKLRAKYIATDKMREIRKVLSSEKTPESIRTAKEYALRDSKLRHVFADVFAGRLKLNPTVGTVKVAFTTGMYYSDLKSNLDQVSNVLEFYDPKINDSGMKVKFPGYSGELKCKSEKEKLAVWMANLDELLQHNSVTMVSKAAEDDTAPAEAANNPEESWLEFGWNETWEIIYVLFNGHPLRIGLYNIKNREPWNLPRTNALVHRSPNIVKDFGAQASKRQPWTEWVKKNIYPVALIEPSNQSDTLSDKRRKSLKEARLKADSSSSKTPEEIEEEDNNINNAELSAENEKEAIRKKIEANDQTLTDLQNLLKTVKKADEIYDLVFNKLPFESMAMEFLRCIGQDLDADGIVELLIRLALKEIFEAAGVDPEKGMETVDKVLEIILVSKDCALDILESGFELYVLTPVEEAGPPDPDMELPDFESVQSTPDAAGAGLNNEDPGITHVVSSIPVSEPYSNPVDADDKKATFWRTLPWERDPNSAATGYTPSGGTAFGRLEPGTALIKIESVPTPSPTDDGYYEGGTSPPGIENTIFASGYIKVKLYDSVADLAAGTVGYVNEQALDTFEAAIDKAITESDEAIILKKGSKDGQNGLTNEVKSLQSYMGSEINQGAGPPPPPGTYVAGKLGARDLILELKDDEEANEIAKKAGVKAQGGKTRVERLLEIEITNLDGIFQKRMHALTKILGRVFVKAYDDLPADAEKQPLISLKSAQKMLNDGVVTKAAIEKIRVVYQMKIQGALEAQSLEQIKNFLSFRTPAVILGNVMFAPPGFYDGENSECNDLFIDLVEAQQNFEAAVITNGATARPSIKARLKVESIFEQYKVCMSAQGTNTYGNYISHLFGRDITPEEQQEKDAFKIIFGATDSVESEGLFGGTFEVQVPGMNECFELEEALKTALGGDMWPGAAAASPDQQKALDDWLACVHNRAQSEAAAIAEIKKENLKKQVNHLHVSSRHKVPTTFEEVFDLFVNKQMGIGGIPGIRLRDGAGLAIADAILLPGRPCNQLMEILVEMLVAYIIKEYPEIELSVRYTLMAYKKSFELYALVRQKISGGWQQFGIPEFPKLPTVKHDQLQKKFQEALEKVLYEILFNTLKDLSIALAEICRLMNEKAADDQNSDDASLQIADRIARYPDAANAAQKVFDDHGINLSPIEVNSQELERDSEIYTEIVSQPTLYAFLMSIIDGLSRNDICSIAQRRHSAARLTVLIGSIKDSLMVSYPEHADIINKDDTIYAIFDMIAEIMPADFCDQVFTPTEQAGFSCLADVIDHNQRQRLKDLNLPDGDIEDLISTRKRRNMDRMVDVTSLITNPEDSVKNAVPDMCEMTKQELLADPSFIHALKATVDAQLQTVKQIFNTDLTSYKPIMLMSSADNPIRDTQQTELQANPFGAMIPPAPEGEDTPGQALSNFNAELFAADSETAILGMIEAAQARAADDDQTEYEQTVDKLGDDMKTEEYFGLYSYEFGSFLTYAQLYHLWKNTRSGPLDEFYGTKGVPGGDDEEFEPMASKGAKMKPVSVIENDEEEFSPMEYEELMTFINPGEPPPEGAADDAVYYEWPPKELQEFFAANGFYVGPDNNGYTPFASTDGYHPLLGLFYRKILDSNGNAAIASLSDDLREALMEWFAFMNTSLFTTDKGRLNDSIKYLSDQSKLDYKKFEVPINQSDYRKKVEESLLSARSSMVMQNLRKSLLDVDGNNILTRPNVTPVGESFKFSLNSLRKTNNDFFANSQYELIDFAFPNTKRNIANDVNISVMTGDPEMRLTQPIMLMNPETGIPFPNPDVNNTKVDLMPGQKTLFAPPPTRPLYAENFVDMIDTFIDPSSTETNQARAFSGFLGYTLNKYFPRPPETGGESTFDRYRETFDQKDVRAVYMSMINTIFENTLRSIGKSKYFSQDEISKLILTPDLESMSKCEDIENFGDLNLLGLDNITDYIQKAFAVDFDPCAALAAPTSGPAEPEALEAIIAEIAVVLYARTIVLETCLSGIHAFGNFNINDLTKDNFMQNYMFSKMKKSLQESRQYVVFKETAVKILDRKRKQNRKVIPLKNGHDSLMHILKEQAEFVAPIYENLLGSRLKDFGQIMMEDIIFPVPVDMNSYFPGNNYSSYDRLTDSISGYISSGPAGSNVKSYYGLSTALLEQDEKRMKVNGVEYTAGEVGALSHAQIFANKPGFIMERYIHLKKGDNWQELVDGFEERNQEKQQGGGPGDQLNTLLPPPEGPYINLDDFCDWIGLIEKTRNEAPQGSSLRTFLNNILIHPWSQYYDISFGLRIKYLLPVNLDQNQSSNTPVSEYFAFSNLQNFVKNLEDFVNDYSNSTGLAAVPTIENPPVGYASGQRSQFKKAGRVAFVSQYNRSLDAAGIKFGTKVYELPLMEETISAKMIPIPGTNEYSINTLTKLKSALKTTDKASDFYDLYILNTLKNKIKNNNQFKSLFEYMIPSKSIIGACSAYARELVDIEYPMVNMFASTKYILAALHAKVLNKNLNPDGSLQTSDFGVDQEDISLEDKITEIMLGFIVKALVTAPFLIIKGVAEAADPNIMITKKIFDAADLVVKTAMMFVVDSFEMARQEYMVIAKETNQTTKDFAAEEGRELLPDELPMPEYNNVREFQAFALGINPPIDPSVGIPKAIAWGLAPGIAIGLMPSMLPFGVGFPPPPFGPGIGPPMTMFAPAYLALGMIKEGGVLDGLYPQKLERGSRDICGAITRRKDPGPEDDDTTFTDYMLDPTNVPPGPMPVGSMDGAEDMEIA